MWCTHPFPPPPVPPSMHTWPACLKWLPKWAQWQPDCLLFCCPRRRPLSTSGREHGSKGGRGQSPSRQTEEDRDREWCRLQCTCGDWSCHMTITGHMTVTDHMTVTCHMTVTGHMTVTCHMPYRYTHTIHRKALVFFSTSTYIRAHCMLQYYVLLFCNTSKMTHDSIVLLQ